MQIVTKKKLALLCVVVIIAAVPATVAEACGERTVKCGPYSEDPGESCMGSDDPFCTGGGGGNTYDHTGGCFDCEWVPAGPDGQDSKWICVDTQPGTGAGKPSSCSDGKYGCETKGMCQLA